MSIRRGFVTIASTLACVGDTTISSDGGVDASASDSPGESATDASGCGAPPHTCATGYACQTGHCGNDVLELAMGAHQACALLYSGEVWCWGLNTYGAVGATPSSTILPPQKIAGVSNIAHIKAHLRSVCAADVGGAVWCWRGVRWAVIAEAALCNAIGQDHALE